MPKLSRSGCRPPKTKLDLEVRGAPSEDPLPPSPTGHLPVGAAGGLGTEGASWVGAVSPAVASVPAPGPRRVLSNRLRTLAARRKMSCRSTVVASVGRL